MLTTVQPGSDATLDEALCPPVLVAFVVVAADFAVHLAMAPPRG